MSRSGYDDNCDNDWSLICYRGAVASAIRGKRGQECLRDLAEAMDAMPVKRLIQGALRDASGEVCAFGALGAARKVPLETIDPEDPETVASTFNVATALAREIAFENDEAARHDETPEQRWARMRHWVAQKLENPT